MMNNQLSQKRNCSGTYPPAPHEAPSLTHGQNQANPHERPSKTLGTPKNLKNANEGGYYPI